MNSLQKLFSPRSVAIVGASSDVTRIGGKPLRYLLEGGYQGRIYPINPNHAEVQGVKAYPSIASIQGEIDCAVLAVPADAILPAVRELAARGVASAVIFSAGFAEMGAEGREKQRQITELARQSGMRIVGPNCLGIFNTHANVYLSFTGVFDDVVGTRGRIGLVSQSGGYGGHLGKIASSRGLKFGLWVTTGNEADVEAGEVLSYMANHPDIDIIIGYLEGARSRDTLIAGLETARRNRKPVIVLKVGRSDAGASAVASHTDAVAGEDDIYGAVFRQYGVYRANSTEEIIDVAYAASRGRFPRDPTLVVLTHSGGVGIQATDYAIENGLSLAVIPQPVREKLSALSPNAATANPVDITAQASTDPSLFGRYTEILMSECGCDTLFVFAGLIAALPLLGEAVFKSFSSAAARLQDKLLVISVLGPRELVQRYEQAGYLVYEEPARAIRAIGALVGFAQSWEPQRDPFAMPPASGLTRAPAQGAFLNEVESKEFVVKAGIPVPRDLLVSTPDEAAVAARKLGGRVALKIVSADILHKTDVGGVMLGVQPDAVLAAARAMEQNVARNCPGARREGFLVTPYYTDGVEVFLAVKRDDVFGPVVVCGIGGVALELYKDVAHGLGPLDRAGAMRLLASLRGLPLLNGFRGRPLADIAALLDAMVALSRFIATQPSISAIEINPLLVLPAGQGVVALDALVRKTAGTTGSEVET